MFRYALVRALFGLSIDGRPVLAMDWFSFVDQVLRVTENPFERVGTMLGHVLLDVGDIVLVLGSIRFDADCSECSACAERPSFPRTSCLCG